MGCMMGQRDTKRRITLRQRIRGLAVGLLLGVSLAVAGVWTGGLHEIQGTVAMHVGVPPVAPRIPIAPRWVDMPTTPFVEVGRRPDGSVDVHRMVAAQLQAGLEPSDIRMVAAMLAEASPTLMGVDDPVLEQMIKDDARAAIARVHVAFPQARARLDMMLVGDDALMVDRDDPFHQIGVRLWYLRALRVAWPDPRRGDVEMRQAVRHVEQAVAASGLRAVHVPYEAWLSGATMDGLALWLGGAHRAVAAQTGWGGPVLGLAGRLELTVGALPDERWGGMVERDRGRLRMWANHDSVVHEWFHALDFVMAETVLTAPVRSMALTAQYGHMRRTEDQQAHDAWRQAHRRIKKHAAGWVGALRAQAWDDQSPYWALPNEHIAYAFDEQVGRSWLVRLGAEHARDDVIPMTDAERVALKVMWADLFFKLKRLNLVQWDEEKRAATAPVR